MFNRMQATLESCVNAAVEKVKEKTNKSLIFAVGPPVNPRRALYAQNLLLISNQVLPVDFQLHCESEIVDVTYALL